MGRIGGHDGTKESYVICENRHKSPVVTVEVVAAVVPLHLLDRFRHGRNQFRICRRALYRQLIELLFERIPAVFDLRRRSQRPSWR